MFFVLMELASPDFIASKPLGHQTFQLEKNDRNNVPPLNISTA